MGNPTRFLVLLSTSTTPSSLLYLRCPSLLRLTCTHRPHRIPFPLSPHYHRHHHVSPSLPHPLSLKLSQHQRHRHRLLHLHAQTTSSFSTPPSRPWSEWSHFVCTLYSSGYFNSHRFASHVNDYVAVSDLPEDFLRAANACLAFASERPDVLGMLSSRDIEVLVQNGVPFLFKNGDDSLRRMALFLRGSNGDVLNTDRAHTSDLMRILLSHASYFTFSEKINVSNKELVESSAQNLLRQLDRLCYNSSDSNLSGSVQNQFVGRIGQTPGSLGQNIEMKRGDWICPGCNFMNFARNMKCLECDAARPKTLLTGSEWECPQCDFFNYGRNLACLRCDCKRPGDSSLGSTNSKSDFGYGNGSYANEAAVHTRLAANEEKAHRWFSRVSQLDNASEMGSAVPDEDFPEIMPLRKGVNRFVVSNRKSPLERRLVNAQHQGNSGNDGTPKSSQTINPSLDEILGQKSAVSESDIMTLGSGENNGTSTPSPVSNSASPQLGASRPRESNYIPYFSSTLDAFPKKSENSTMDENSTKGEILGHNYKSIPSSSGAQTGVFTGAGESDKSGDNWEDTEMPMHHPLNNDNEKEQAEKSERWFERVAELHNVTDVVSENSDDDFPDIMPVRKGENRFVVGKKKDRTLTSPIYKRRMSMEQANNTNYVPFVPLPPNYFAKKDDKKPDGANSPSNAMSKTSSSEIPEKPLEKLDGTIRPVFNATDKQGEEPQQYSGSWNSVSSDKWNEMRASSAAGAPRSGNSTQKFVDPSMKPRNENVSGTPNLMGNSGQTFTHPHPSSKDCESRGSSGKENNETANLMGTTSLSSEKNDRDSWTGKSLEGSAVKEQDPLDMSEEAKAERWFRRVAQIKDISELSQIPDEDFPSIMPMRKGVNRFVVSKRKTPLERRLTSTRYKRNLPIVSSDSMKEDHRS